MGAKLNKVAGEKAKCPSCGGDIICVEKPASGNFAARLQWQNMDYVSGKSLGTAHYNFDGTNTTCANVIVEDPKNKARSDSPYKFETNADVKRNLPKIAPSPEITEACNIVLQAMNVADEQCRAIYPNLSPDGNTFGMISSKFTENLLSIYCCIKKAKQ